MYQEHQGRKEIVLWCYGKVGNRKRSAESSADTGKTKASKGYTTHQEKMTKTQDG